ncbi:ribosomal protein S24e [Kipferlia bialata]|uniref:Ribosomal protein S24e n=1 Tax=Kipferlia bialata TaxID=797122 RepID=A0A391NUH0_9EUKA|nr:ribosomal protein S24e [Kipferlia bialata]|eukprot:g1371.t1
MPEKTVIRTRRFMQNPLLHRRQMVVEVTHTATRAPTRREIRDRVAELYHITNKDTIVLTGFKTHFGGGFTSGFCRVYDDLKHLQKVEAKFVQCRMGLAKRVERSRKQIKMQKNRALKQWGTKKTTKKN